MNLRGSTFCLLFLLSSFSGFATLAQNLDQLREKEMLNAKLREEDEKNRKQAEKSIETARKDMRTASPGLSTKIYHSEKDLPATEKKLLLANSSEAEKYAAFLRQPNTGLFKLLNFKEANLAVNDVRSQSAYPQIPGGGTYYSFTKRNHVADEWAQIRLWNGALQMAYSEMKRTTITESGGVKQSFTYTSGYSWAVLTELGDVALEVVTRETPTIKSLAALQPPTQYQEFSRQQKLYEAGIVTDNKTYKTSAPAKLNTTYALRSLNYKRLDEIIAFRVIHEDGQGNLHILWKQIAHYPPPELKGKPQK